MSTTTTHIETEKQEACPKRKRSVPALRFKDFAGMWTKMRLDSVSDKISDGTHFSPQLYEQGNYKYISSKNIRNGYMILDDVPYVSDVVHKEIYSRCDVQFNDILLTKDGASTGNVCLNELDEEFSLLSSVAMIRCDSKGAINEYVYQYICSPYGQYEIRSTIAGQAITRITLEKLRGYKFSFPSLPEQQKIASFLSAVDEKLQQLTKKKALLEHYKKGVMQQLFSGQLRFKDENGNDYPDWEEKLFSDLYSFHSTNSLSRDKLNYDAGSVYNIHYGDIHTKFKTAFNLNEAYIPFVNDDVDLSKIKTDSYCNNGDLVMADASEDYADIGKTIELIDLKDENVLAGLHTFLARPITSKTTIGFFSVLLKSWSMRKQIMVIAQGTKVLSLSTTRVGKLKLKLPIIEEQQKIATYVSRIDTKIAAVTHQITQTQTFKKGLLQGMFV
jgi:type I restriction enzyme S subunit